MIKVLLVDDEQITREGLRDFMPWEQLGLEVCGEAADGVQALKIAVAMKPEIIVSDIKMPGIDGLELIERLKETNPGIKIIFISGHQEFEYARKAVALNAFDYVLKPVNFNELSKLLSKVTLQIKDEQYSYQQKEQLRRQINENRYYLQQQFLLEIISYDTSAQKESHYSRADYLDLSFPHQFFGVVVVAIDNYKEYDHMLTEENKQFLNTIVFNLLDEIKIGNSRMYVVRMNDGMFSVIMNMAENDILFKNEIMHAFDNFLKQMELVCSETATIGISDFCTELQEVHMLYNQALTATKAKWLLGKRQVIFASDISVGSAFMLDKSGYSAQMNELSRLILAGDIQSTKQIIRNLFDSMQSVTLPMRQEIQNACLAAVNACRGILLEIGEDPELLIGDHLTAYKTVFQIDTLKDLELWLTKILEETCEAICQKRKDKNSILVNEITAIVDNRFHENISLEDIAREVFFSPNYIRKVFKDETGQTISDYLFQVRMKHAAELMKDPKLHVYEIGQKVGYENSSYFGQIFKQHFGVTPKEYKDLMDR